MLPSALALLALLLALGVGYSTLYNTYLDTSNPFLTSHPLAASHYFADKGNILNVYFIKRGWAWTTAIFFINWFSSPPSVRTRQRVLQYLLATSSWLLFTAWFFGPSLFERFVIASGGECLLNVPSGQFVTVPNSLCYSKSTVTPTTHPELFASPAFVSLSLDQSAFPIGWNSIPRLRRGHDVSGHIFLLTLSILLLVDQLKPSFYIRREQCKWPTLHYTAVVATMTLIAVWFFGVYTTSVYFHSPMEKVTGFLLGIIAFAPTQLPFVKFRYPEQKSHNN